MPCTYSYTYDIPYKESMCSMSKSCDQRVVHVISAYFSCRQEVAGMMLEYYDKLYEKWASQSSCAKIHVDCTSTEGGAVSGSRLATGCATLATGCFSWTTICMYYNVYTITVYVYIQ